jgi:hypothetical protein
LDMGAKAAAVAITDAAVISFIVSTKCMVPASLLPMYVVAVSRCG